MKSCLPLHQTVDMFLLLPQIFTYDGYQNNRRPLDRKKSVLIATNISTRSCIWISIAISFKMLLKTRVDSEFIEAYSFNLFENH